MTEHSADTVERVYLIRKHGGYYRPNSQGYTNSALTAGRYTRAEAESISHPNGPKGPRDGMSYIHEDDVECENLAFHRAALSALTVEDAAKVLLDACPNPIFDNLKYPLLGEFTQTQCYVDENGDEDSMIVTIEWCVIKEIIEAALRAIADTPKEGETNADT